MTQEQFTEAVMEQLFVRGFQCPDKCLLTMYVRMEWARLGGSPDHGPFAEMCAEILRLRNDAVDPRMGIPSPTAGARDEWLAVHEAGHAIVVVRAGMTLRGVRFYGNGFPGETGFEEPDWEESTDEDLLRRLIRIDVAANIAELTCGHEPEGGYPSRFFDHRKPVTGEEYPSDIIGAWKHALRLATVQFEREGWRSTAMNFGLRGVRS